MSEKIVGSSNISWSDTPLRSLLSFWVVPALFAWSPPEILKFIDRWISNIHHPPMIKEISEGNKRRKRIFGDQKFLVILLEVEGLLVERLEVILFVDLAPCFVPLLIYKESRIRNEFDWLIDYCWEIKRNQDLGIENESIEDFVVQIEVKLI